MSGDVKKVPAEGGGSEVAGAEDKPRQNPMVTALAAGLGAGAIQIVPTDIRNGFVFGGLFGLIVGLLPFTVARARGLPDDATRHLLWCGGLGMLGGLILAAPASLYFTYKAATVEVAP